MTATIATTQLPRWDDIAAAGGIRNWVDAEITRQGLTDPGASSATTDAEPPYVVDDIVHYCVTNMPGAVGRTSTYALCNATLPYVLDLAREGVGVAAERSAAIRSAVNVWRGELVQPAVAAAFGLRCAEPRFGR